ncbi:hypothetical protein OHAE_4542 [Ochrobactrum soli]|uniref:Uncharacterized protein n=1 Tax=Ochrobactrum soli TaxID=2448455 RepID=A0A2P9HD31_9HYPH|nr:hypothetical protein OHAE_4542 [[Ochrobactrum] soli]
MGLAIGIFVLSAPSFAQSASDDIDELARKVSNPASFMISVPVHSDIVFGRGSGKVRGFSLSISNQSFLCGSMIAGTLFPTPIFR